jgi:hypothetical protein
MAHSSNGKLPSLLIALTLGLLVGTWTTTAQADSAASFGKAVELFEAKKCDEALPMFEAVVAETGSPNARIYLARCLEQEGRLADAYEQMRQTVAEATKRAETEEKYVPTRDSAASELALLEPKIGKVVVAVVDPPEGTEVYVGTRRLDADQLGVPVAVMPGTLDVRAQTPDGPSVQREVEVEAGKTRTITLTMDEGAPSSDQIPEPPRNQTDTTTSTMGGIRIAGFVVTGLGLAGVGVGAGLAAKAQSDFDALDEECGGVTCPTDEQGRVDDGRLLTTVANVSLIAGGIIAAGGITMIILGGDSASDGDDSAHLEIVPMVGPTTNGLTLTGRF